MGLHKRNRLTLGESLRLVGLSFSTTLCDYHSNPSCNYKEANGEEEPKEPLGIVTKVTTIIFLVAFTDFLPFISKHGIDLTDIRLHLCGHPLAFFVKQFLDFLPVCIIDIYRHLYFCGSIFQDFVYVLIDGINLFADSSHSTT